MGRFVTVKDIAQEAEVSIATVSRVLNNRGNIKDDLRQRVLQVAAELGYFKAAGSTSRNEKRAIKEIVILLTYSELEEPPLDTFWAHILHGAEIEARKTNTYVTYHSINLNPEPYHLLSKLHEMRVDGILLIGPANPEIVRLIQTTNIPLVLVDNYVRIPGQQFDTILSDNFEGAREAITYLINAGHQQIAFLGGHIVRPENKIYTFERRKDGYLAALYDAELTVHQSLIERCGIRDPDDIYAACKRLVTSGIAFSALFCVNDRTAGQAIKALKELGYRIPEDISVIGFDDTEIAEHFTPPLTTVRVHKDAMGAVAIRRINARITDPHAIGITHILDVELVKRESVYTRKE